MDFDVQTLIAGGFCLLAWYLIHYRHPQDIKEIRDRHREELNAQREERRKDRAAAKARQDEHHKHTKEILGHIVRELQK